MLANYIKNLIKKSSFIIFTIIDSIFFIAGLISIDLKIPPFFYIIILLIGIQWGNYDLYKEHIKTIEKLSTNEIKFEIFFKNINHDGEGIYKLSFEKIENQNFDSILETKRVELLSEIEKSKRREKINFHLEMNWSYKQKNDNFEEDVEHYIESLKIYLSDKRKFDLIEKRLLRFEPQIRNIGNKNSTNNRLEFSIPQVLSFPTAEQLLWVDNPEYFPSPPKEPSFFIDPLNGSPNSFLDRFQVPNLFKPNIQNDRNIKGPYYSDLKTISYEIENVIPNLLLDDFDPFFLWFDSIDSNISFIFSVKIYSAELSIPYSRDLDFTIKIV